MYASSVVLGWENECLATRSNHSENSHLLRSEAWNGVAGSDLHLWKKWGSVDSSEQNENPA